MPRRNQRVESFVPLDLTPAEISKPKPVTHPWLRDDPVAIEDRAAERRLHAERQNLARVNRGIDWSVCVVPGCGTEVVPQERRDPRIELPICYEHGSVVWRQMLSRHADQPAFVEAVADVNARVAAREQSEADEAKRDFLAREDGDIYFVRSGQLVKVGWTRNLPKRLKAYGASAELLVAYPGTRNDETNLHRQLEPARVRGREWYEDGPIIQDFIDKALAQYGQPPTFDTLWTEPKRVVAGKRASRGR